MALRLVYSKPKAKTLTGRVRVGPWTVHADRLEPDGRMRGRFIAPDGAVFRWTHHPKEDAITTRPHGAGTAGGLPHWSLLRPTFALIREGRADDVP